MGFVRMPGVTGLVYVPEESGEKKHPCKDCFCCQWCSDGRCHACLKKNSSCKDKKGEEAHT